MFINDLDIYLIDYPRISAPHYIYVGDLEKASIKPLSSDLEKFVASAEKGTIIITFGQMVNKIPDMFLEKIFLIGVKIPHTHFVIRNGVEVTLPVPSNVKVMKWIPQNDLLGHPNVKVMKWIPQNDLLGHPNVKVMKWIPQNDLLGHPNVKVMKWIPQNDLLGHPNVKVMKWIPQDDLLGHPNVKVMKWIPQNDLLGHPNVKVMKWIPQNDLLGHPNVKVMKWIPQNDLLGHPNVKVMKWIPQNDLLGHPNVKVMKWIPQNDLLGHPNVKVMKWIPQNDLLGHPNVKVLMSQAGTNGVRMAINFGKPMILAPVTGLEYNVLQAKLKQYCKRIDLLHDSADDIVEVILEVLENPVYTQNVEEAILLFITVIIILFVFVTYKCCKYCCNTVQKSYSKPKTEYHNETFGNSHVDYRIITQINKQTIVLME